MNNQKILLIDYDPASISKAVTPLTKAGYSVEVAKDGLSGLAAFERMKPALVLVEAMLPRKHGFEVCQEIKAKPDGKSTPVLITSAVCRGRKYRMDALQIYGCDEYIEKPIPDQDLLTLIGRLIEHAAEATEEVKQELSSAIDTAATDPPGAIDSMSDDELEAKIDSMLMADVFDAPTESAPVVATVAPEPTAAPEATAAEPVQPAEPEKLEAVETDPEPVEKSPAQESAVPETVETEPENVEPEFDAKSEMERRVEAMVQVDPEKIDSPPIDPFAEVQEDTEAEDEFTPAVEEASAPDPPVAEWTETATPGGGSKAILIGVAAIVVLGVVGFLAFQQGWIGGGAESLSAAGPAIENTPAPADAEPTPAVVAEQAFSGQEANQDPVQVSVPPTRPEPVDVTQAEPRPELPAKPKEFKGRSRAELQAANKRQKQAEQAMVAAAGSLQASLLDDEIAEPTRTPISPVEPVNLDEDLIGTPVPPKPQTGQLFEINNVDTIPVPVRFTQPVYDEMARRMRHEGEVLVSVLIDETGKVTDVELIKEIPRSRLNDSTVRAARRWTYEPAVKDGVKVSVWKTERILFSLN